MIRCKFYFILLIIIIIFVVKALLVIRQDWVGSTLGEQGPHTRPGLVFRAVLRKSGLKSAGQGSGEVTRGRKKKKKKKNTQKGRTVWLSLEQRA